jgi:hypothetical protein
MPQYVVGRSQLRFGLMPLVPRVTEFAEDGNCDCLKDLQPGFAPIRFPIAHRVLVHSDGFREVHLPPPPFAAVLPEPVGEGLGGVAGNCQGEFYRPGVFGCFINLDCTGRLAAWQPTKKTG